MMALRSPGRLATAVGLAVAAVGATVMAVSVAYAAPQAGTCNDNVNVRDDSQANARITGLCKKGTAVTIEEHRTGFVKIKDNASRQSFPVGWADERYVTTATTATP